MTLFYTIILIHYKKGYTMTKNVGQVDKTIRITAGVVLIIIGFLMEDWIIGIIGIVPLLTGVLGWCPLYCPLKISTCSTDSSK